MDFAECAFGNLKWGTHCFTLWSLQHRLIPGILWLFFVQWEVVEIINHLYLLLCQWTKLKEIWLFSVILSLWDLYVLRVTEASNRNVRSESNWCPLKQKGEKQDLHLLFNTKVWTVNFELSPLLLNSSKLSRIPLFIPAEAPALSLALSPRATLVSVADPPPNTTLCSSVWNNNLFSVQTFKLHTHSSLTLYINCATCFMIGETQGNYFN